MSERRYSTVELATHAGLPVPTVKYLVSEGVLQASVQRAEGRGHGNVFSFADVLAAKSLGSLRVPNASARPLRHLVHFWYSSAGEKLVRAVVRDLAERGDETEPRDRGPVVLLVTENGVSQEDTPAALMKNQGAHVVFCLDARRLIEELYLTSVEALMRCEFKEPTASGRVPRQKKKKPAKRRRPKLPALLREAGERLAREAREKKTNKGTNK